MKNKTSGLPSANLVSLLDVLFVLIFFLIAGYSENTNKLKTEIENIKEKSEMDKLMLQKLNDDNDILLGKLLTLQHKEIPSEDMKETIKYILSEFKLLYLEIRKTNTDDNAKFSFEGKVWETEDYKDSENILSKLKNGIEENGLKDKLDKTIIILKTENVSGKFIFRTETALKKGNMNFVWILSSEK